MFHCNTLNSISQFRRTSMLGCGALFFAALSLATGCGTESVSEGNLPEETFTQTVLRRDDAGKLITYSRTITASEQRALNASRAQDQAQGGGDFAARAQGLYADAYCQGSDMWIYDGPNGTGNMLCLAGEGVADLNLYNDGRNDCVWENCAMWTGQIRSFWPGVDGSWFSNDYTGQSPSTCWRYYYKWGPLTNADSCVSISRYIGLYVAH